jgi:fatty acid desaturase
MRMEHTSGMSDTRATTNDVEDFDPSRVDMEGFRDEIRALRREIDASLCEDDVTHLQKMERWGRACTFVGLATAGICPNPVSAVALAMGRSARWMLMHHIGHRGYDHVPGVPAKYTSRVFARGHRRFLDWADWMVPEAWIYEHNVLHHSFTGEARDPDLVERNMDVFNSYGLPRAAGYAAFGFYSLTWKFLYYAPSTLGTWMHRGQVGSGSEKPDELEAPFSDLFFQCYLPYATLMFGALPAMYAPFGPWAWLSALTNSVMAEAIANVHTLCVIGPNHAGDDLYRFEDRPSSRGEGYVRQVIGSVNYRTGSDVVDFAHMWLNYQIEHHVFPDLPMRQYRIVQPKLKAICEKYGVPYAEGGVVSRVKKMIDVFVGKTKMRKAPPAPWQAGAMAAE